MPTLVGAKDTPAVKPAYITFSPNATDSAMAAMMGKNVPITATPLARGPTILKAGKWKCMPDSKICMATPKCPASVKMSG